MLGLSFMILLLGIYIPDIILIRDSVYDIFDGFKGSHHGVINVVVSVLSVTSYTI